MRKTDFLRRAALSIVMVTLGTTCMMAQDPFAEGLVGVATVVGEAKTAEATAIESIAAGENRAATGTDGNRTATATGENGAAAQVALKEIPVWKQKLYYGYNFDIYYHNDSRSSRKENGWSISVTPEIGWRLNERVHFGLRVGGGYQDTYTAYIVEEGDGTSLTANLRVQQGSWEVTPYGRYRLKTLFNEKVGIWIEAHLYAGMEFPRVTDGVVKGTDYDGLRHSITYGAQVSPVITYQFNKKSTFQIFFSILSFGYSGTTFCYKDPLDGHRYNEQTHDVIIFSGKLRNMIANQFTPGLYGLKFGVQKNF